MNKLTHHQLQNLYHNVGHNIFIARKRRGITRQKLSEMTGISVPTLARFERGNMSVSVEKLIMILNILQFDNIDKLTDPAHDMVALNNLKGKFLNKINNKELLELL